MLEEQLKSSIKINLRLRAEGIRILGAEGKGFPGHAKLHANLARNLQLLRQIDVGTVNILFNRPTSIQVAGKCTTRTNVCTVESVILWYIETGPA